jgi:molybdate transport system substrate-binding protein
MEEIVTKRRIKKLGAAAGLLALAAGLSFVLAPRTRAQAELRVFTSGGMKPTLEALIPQIEQSIGCKLAPQFNSSKNLREKIQAGEPFDVAILTSDVIDDLIQRGKIAAGSRTDLARTGMGVGVRAGAAKPDISTPEALKKTLLAAKSIAFNPTGASAVHTYEMFEHLGITNAVKPKLLLDSKEEGRPQKSVAEGAADLVITLIPEIKFFPGVDLVGPVPADFQSYISFSAGVATNTSNAKASKALIQFIKGPEGVKVLKAKAMEPR